jgi:tetratricopeptide (TPR) repeat protein
VLRAEHLERAEDPEAPQAFLDAARALSAALRPDVARSLAERGAALAPPGAVALELSMLAGDLACDLGDGPAGAAAYSRADALARDDTQRCLAQIGLASAHRLSSDTKEGFGALDRAEPIAERLGLARELARIAYLRGSLHFARGELERCAAEHERSLSHARAAGDEQCEAQALSGIADATYATGRLVSSHAAFERCVALCERRGNLRYALMNRLMAGLIDHFLGESRRSLERIDAVRVAAHEIGHAVAEVMAGQVAAMVLVSMGRDEEAIAAAEPSLALARAIASRRFIAFDLYQLGRAGRRHGDREVARARLDESWAVLEDVGPGLAGAMVLGAKACIARSDDERRDLIARGEALLQAGAISHNHFFFREDAIEASLGAGDLDEALRHADALERYASREPTSWSRFIVARARALVAARRASADVRELRALHDHAIAHDLRAALPAIEQALAAH